MKKLVAAIATGVIIAGAAVTNVSAEEYEVQKGDSLWDIAENYNTTVDELVDINELKSTMIHPKQTLFINEEYVVQKGDTLISIGNDHDVTVDELKEWNSLTSSVIVIGQELTIKGVNVSQEDKPAAEITEEPKESSEESKQNTQNNVSAKESSEKETETKQEAEGKTISVTATAYTAGCAGCSGVTSTGINLNENPSAKVIAVDPNVIPLGTEVYVEGYGYAVAGDIGSAIKGNKIDIHVPTKDEAYSWGVRTVDVTVVE
ncbi:cell wall-binding protein [Virgibacillus profundi]|uniref:Cell wall-binding protein n=1 Tax=Virgibacillus profundi TaxID=2024555 RepID=A0A2A2IJY0_9BACI|nr:3D domain-containing protein [Virgibacillus profundi]PAV31460.1 cell wall-binding protein [Virgibacillus profundi]PXY55646.1 LysM peptidoglycan-binding domain-containing protein [Virgibacillus profundi]